MQERSPRRWITFWKNRNRASWPTMSETPARNATTKRKDSAKLKQSGGAPPAVMVDSSRVSSASGLHMRKILSFFLLTAFLCSLAAQDKRGASTPEERQRAAAIAHKLEEAPLDKNLQQEREWAMRSEEHTSELQSH